jgi:hypothetical protein
MDVRLGVTKLYLKETSSTVKLGDKEQIGVKEPFPVTNLPIYFIRVRNIWC